MTVNAGERMEAAGPGDAGEDTRRMHREFIARAVEQARAGSYGLADPGSPDISPEDLIGPYDGAEGPEDVEPGHVKDVPEETPAEEAAVPSGPPAAERPARAAAPRPRPQARFRKPRKARTPREKLVSDSRDDLKPFPFGSREDED